MRILGLDVGEKKVGVAISDPYKKIALRLKIYERRTLMEDMELLRKIKEDYDIEKVVVGLPKDLNANIGKRARDVMKYRDAIEKEVKIPTVLWDERFSTNEAKRVFDLFGVNNRKRKKYLDITAAQLILQGYLDAQKT